MPLKGILFKYKVALTLTLTTRGIPQLFYGTEIGLNGGGHHGKIRQPFPGGFPGDSLDAFAENGRNETQNEIFNFTKRLLELRKNNDVIRTGKLIQFQPINNIYVYKKVNHDKTIIFIINNSKMKTTLNLKNYIDNTNQFSNLKDILLNYVANINDLQMLSLDPESINIYECK